MPIARIHDIVRLKQIPILHVLQGQRIHCCARCLPNNIDVIAHWRWWNSLISHQNAFSALSVMWFYYILCIYNAASPCNALHWELWHVHCCGQKEKKTEKKGGKTLSTYKRAFMQNQSASSPSHLHRIAHVLFIFFCQKKVHVRVQTNKQYVLYVICFFFRIYFNYYYFLFKF